MHGTVLAPLKCTASMSHLGANAHKRGEPILIYKDTVKVPGMGMIDDLATVTKCDIETVKSNSVTNSFIESKRL